MRDVFHNLELSWIWTSLKHLHFKDQTDSNTLLKIEFIIFIIVIFIIR